MFGELGLDAKQSARWFRLIGGFASGAGMAEVASRERVADATPLRLERSPEMIAYPRVRAVAPHLSVKQLDSVFEFGLDVLFGALAAQTRQAVSRPGAVADRAALVENDAPPARRFQPPDRGKA